jgi:hypothetical protein
MSGGPRARHLKMTVGDSELERPPLGKEEQAVAGSCAEQVAARQCHQLEFHTHDRLEAMLAGERYVDVRGALNVEDRRSTWPQHLTFASPSVLHLGMTGGG